MAEAPLLMNFIDLYKDQNRRKRYRKKNEWISVDERPLDFDNAKYKLEKNLNFFHVLTPDVSEFDGREMKNISKKVVQLLRHSLPASGLKFAKDGSVLLGDVIQLWRNEGLDTTEQKVIAASNPIYGSNKLRFLVGEKIGSGKFLVAVGGHTFNLPHPFGSIPIETNTAWQVDPAFHRTDARFSIERDGFISQMQRGGGINLSYGEQHPYFQAGHGYKIFVEDAINEGIFFCHNRFSDVLFCLGKMENNDFDGMLPLSVGDHQLAVYC